MHGEKSMETVPGKIIIDRKLRKETKFRNISKASLENYNQIRKEKYTKTSLENNENNDKKDRHKELKKKEKMHI